MKKMIVRVTKTEFEVDSGEIYPIPFPLDRVPTVAEFQKIYDRWFQIFQEEGIVDEQID